MRADSYLTKIDDLQRWFDMNNTGKLARPYFTIYRGLEAKQDRVIYRNEEISEPDKAWELMEEIINAHSEGGGMFRVFIVDAPKHNIGISTLVKIPNPLAPAGIGNPGAGTYGIYGNFREALEMEVARERKMWELEQRINELQNGAAVSGLDQFKELIAEVPALNSLIHAIGMKVLGMSPAAPVHHQPGAPGSGHTDANLGDDANGYDYERVDPALDQLREVVPDVESALEGLAVWAKRHPEQARLYLNSLNAT